MICLTLNKALHHLALTWGKGIYKVIGGVEQILICLQLRK